MLSKQQQLSNSYTIPVLQFFLSHILCELFLVHIHRARAFKNHKNTFKKILVHIHHARAFKNKKFHATL
jgi:hypothetical protein